MLCCIAYFMRCTRFGLNGWTGAIKLQWHSVRARVRVNKHRSEPLHPHQSRGQAVAVAVLLHLRYNATDKQARTRNVLVLIMFGVCNQDFPTKPLILLDRHKQQPQITITPNVRRVLLPRAPFRKHFDPNGFVRCIWFDDVDYGLELTFDKMSWKFQWS